jgi:hypothetical protein
MHGLNLKFFRLPQVELQGLNVIEVQPSRVDVSRVYSIRIVVHCEDSALFMVLGKEEGKNSASTAKVEHIVGLQGKTVYNLLKMHQIALRCGKPHLAKRVHPISQGINSHSFLLVLLLCLSRLEFMQRLKCQHVLIPTSQAANKGKLSSYFRLNFALKVKDLLSASAPSKGIVIGLLELLRNSR